MIAFFIKALDSSKRWLTVHPNGPGTKGQPILVQEEKDGTSRVIGGAGGSLNFLRFNRVKSKKAYQAEAKERRNTSNEKKKQQRKRDKELGIDQSKAKAKEQVHLQVSSEENQLIQTVADAMGWDMEKLALPEAEVANLSESAQKKAVRKHHAILLKHAKEAVEVHRRMLLEDAEARTEAGLGDIPLESATDDQLSTQDLDPVHTSSGLGYSTHYKERAEKSGLTGEELDQEKAAVKPNDERSEKRRIDAESIKKEIENIREPEFPEPKIADAKQAVAMLKADKRLRMIRQKARAANKQIDESSREPEKIYLLEVGGEEVSARVKAELGNDLKTIATTAFLSEAGTDKDDYRKTLGRHLGVGAYNAVNSLSLAASGAALVGRDAADVLGIGAAAQILARRLQNDLTEDELHDVQNAMEAYHVEHYMEATKDAIEKARQAYDLAKSVELSAATDGHDLAEMQELNAKRRDAIETAQRILGTTLGEVEANAALVSALKHGTEDNIQTNMGNLSTEDAIVRARAIGLNRGDYQITRVGANTFMTVTGQGMDRLAKPVNREDLERVRNSLDIIEGRRDEDGWLPGGVANRPDLSMDVKPGVVPQLAEPFAPGADLGQSIKDYIGGRTADGDPPDEILHDLLTHDTLSRVDHGEFMTELDKISPMKDGKGGLVRAEAHTDAFQKMADEFVKDRYGQDRSPLHRQSFTTDQKSVDALHRALAAEPAGTVAYKPVGELGHNDQRALRSWFAENVAKHDEGASGLRAQIQELEKGEPEKETEDMFGTGTNPAWTEWKQRRDGMVEELSAKGLNWGKYIEVMGGPAAAYTAVQDLVRSRVAQKFHETYNTLNPDSPLKLGRTVVNGNLNHLDAVDPAARDRRFEEQKKFQAGLHERDIGGRWARGSIKEKESAARESQAAAEQSQMGFFSAESASDKPLKADERYTLGQSAEKQIAGMMGIVGQNFKPDKPTKLWQASMNGKFINAQRAVKLIEQNKRVVLNQGTGSGKSLMILAGFTNLNSKKLAKKGIFVVPSIVQGEFSGEALRYLEPGKYKWNIQPGASRDERIVGYKDPDSQFSVVTHQAFRDDLMYLAAKQAGTSTDEMTASMQKMTPAERKDWMRGVMDKAGIPVDYLAVDEGQVLLNREGKKDSIMANVIDSVSANTPYFVSASADPIKNDASEAYDLMRKMDPERYPDRDQFMRRYGVDTVASKDALRREMARYFFPGHIQPDIQRNKQVVTVPLSAGQQKQVQAVNKAAAQARLARIKGEVDVEAMKRLSPNSFDGVDPAHHKEVAGRLQKSIGMIRVQAVKRVINSGDDNAKIEHLSDIVRKRAGKPGVVFAHSLAAVQKISDRLKAEGHRVVTMTGKDSAKEKEAKKLAFRPEQGEASADIMVVSDAAQVGMNAQRGQWLVQFDTPDTAMGHAQRNGRIDRLGQQNNIELIDLVADSLVERKARKRLATKYALRDVINSPLAGLDDTGVAGHLNRVRENRAQETLF